MILPASDSLAIYVHWPFCLSKCPYCDFNSHVIDEDDQAKWIIAYRRELEHYAAILGKRRVTSVFFGGGTPSLMRASTVDSVLGDIARLWSVEESAEITLEANPSSADADKFIDFCKSGVNRLSLGVQSLDDNALRFLGRAHDAQEAKKAISVAANVFPRFSFDLIYAYQGQTLDQWRTDLREAVDLSGGHVSLYQLTVEPHTPFHTRMRKGEVLTVVDDCAEEMYDVTQEIMDDAGLPAYEISNHAKPGQECRHNLVYWRYNDYLGIGPGAHGRYVYGTRRNAVENHRAPDAWMRQVDAVGQGSKNIEVLDEATAMREALIVGLRLNSGIRFSDWNSKFSIPVSSFLCGDQLNSLIRQGLVLVEDDCLRTSAEGSKVLNSILKTLLC